MTTKQAFWYATGIFIITVSAAFLFGDWWFRCHGKPLGRVEALHRANVSLQYLSRDWVLGDPMPSLASEQFDPSDGSWMFTFKNSVCEVSIITDRCKGTDVGGMSQGCTTHRGAER